jgi:hypothetical protein
VVGAALLGLASRVSAADAPELAGVVAVAGVAGLAAGLVLRRGGLATMGLALVGSAYAVSLIGKGLDPAACLVAGGLLFVAELTYWALEPGAAVRIGRRATARRAVFSGALALGAVVVGSLLLGIASAPSRGGEAIGILGVAALAAILAAVIGLMHSLRPRGPVR